MKQAKNNELAFIERSSFKESRW